MTAAHAGTAMASDRIDLIDKDQTGSALLTLFKQVANTRSTDTHEHLHEVGTRDREEWNVRFTRDGASEKVLTCTGMANEQHALRNASAELSEFFRFSEELDDLT